MNAVIFEANSDETTKRVHIARRKALASLPANPEYDLFGIYAFPTDVTSTYARAGRFELFSGMGHGSVNEFTGQCEHSIFSKHNGNGVNRTLIGSIVHLYSCSCAQGLGPHLVKFGAKAFIGYSGPVAIPYNQNVLEEFVKVAAVIDRSVLRGDSAVQTRAKADAEYNAIESWLLSPSSPATPREVASFRMNNKAMVGPWTGSQYGTF